MDFCTISNTSCQAFPPGDENLILVSLILIGAVQVAGFLFSLPANSYVVWLILRRRREKKLVSDFIPLNQTLAEILYYFLGALSYFKSFFSPTFKMLKFISVTIILVRLLAQSFICLEQYLATIHPVIFLRCKPMRHRLICCSLSWLIVTAVSAISTWPEFEREVLLMMAALYQFFILFMMFCCISVLRALKRPGPGEGRKDQRKGSRIKKRAFNVILVNLVQSMMSQVPLAVLFSLTGTLSDAMFNLVIGITGWFSLLSSLLPALMYLYKVRILFRK